MDEIRAMAAKAYNDAFEAVDSGEQPAWGVELAATSLNLWRRVGNEQNLAIGCWLYSRALAKAGAGALSLEVARNCLTHVDAIDEPADWLKASALEGYARALLAAADERFTQAVTEAQAAVAAIADEKARELIGGQLADLLDLGK